LTRTVGPGKATAVTKVPVVVCCCREARGGSRARDRAALVAMA